MQTVVDEGPTQAAVLRAQRQGQASFVFNVATTARQIQQLVTSVSHGLPEVGHGVRLPHHLRIG